MESAYFQGIIGHGAIKKRLQQLMERDRLPHAMIFAGPAGVGKTLMACAVASAVTGRTVFERREELTDVPVLSDRDEAYYVAPVGAMLKVGQFRQLQSRLMLQGRTARRICVIDHVETMNAEFANCMLKTLEEPPPGVCFILITDQPSLLLPTIISRCAYISFDPVSDEDMLQGLQQLRGGQTSDYEQAVAWGGGIVSAVYAYLDGNGAEEARQALLFLHTISEHACPYAKWLSVSVDIGDGAAMDIFRWIALFLRDLAVLRSGADEHLLRLRQYRKDMMELLPYWPDAGIFTALQVMEEGMEALKRHVNVRLVWDYVCIRCIKAKGGM
ncbi:AAA family ATPase [uncultured Megasphaera sp.]|uniref:DNA polymerase III subunit n=1 Tax=uncultured Megasphaera sp. TaxID=165188 RepID=UPI002659305D|nr:AAA family ATPase [uncultured Megasphaera sp.]